MKNLTILSFTTLTFLFLTNLSLNATIRYITQTGAGNGTSWADASSNLHMVINASSTGDSIWVATGVYKPTRDHLGSSNPANSREKTFYIKDGVKIYGGFAGTETNINQRNIAANPTTLSGDIGVANDNTDNCYHVVLASTSNIGVGVTIDGFTISRGNASGASTIYFNGNHIYRNNGGGIYLYYGTNRLANNTISGNAASEDGGGIYTHYQMNTLTNNTISGNIAYNNGGGISLSSGTNTLLNNTVVGNTANNKGGGIYMVLGTNRLTNNTLSGNTASYYGGGLYTENSTNTLTNNTLSGNAAYYGGGIYTNMGTNTLTNNLFWGNKIDENPNLAGSDYYAYSSNFNTFKNNVLQLPSSNYASNGSLPYGIGTGAAGNVFAQDPLFANATDIDGADNIHRTADDGLRLTFGSSAYNRGTLVNAPVTDITGTARPQFGLIDIGAYESTTILEAVPPTISIGNILPVTCSSGGTMQVNISGGTPPYLQLWSNGATTTTISNLGAGIYNVMVTDANNFTVSASASIIEQVAVPTGLTTTNITATTATLNWNAVTGSTNYTIQGRKIGSSSWITVGPVGGTSKTISSSLMACKNYEWKVRANCVSGAVSAFSSIATFTTTGCGIEGKTNGEWDGNIETFSLQPNPANSLVTLNYFSDSNMLLNIKVIDMTGRIMLQQNTTIIEGDNSIDLPTHNLPQGYYMVEANNGITQSYQKLLILR